MVTLLAIWVEGKHNQTVLCWGKMTSLEKFCLVVSVYVGGCLHGGELHLETH